MKEKLEKSGHFAIVDFISSTCRYICREDFEADARLVFHNCEVFNEDDSDVGRAGHSMHRFFKKRWTELQEDQT